MNNDQFRKLVLANSESSGTGNNGSPAEKSGRAGGSAPSSLGSKKHSSIPMTPRSVGGAGHVNFARQVAERNKSSQPQKSFRTSAPKGSKLAQGYVDRAKARPDDEDDDRVERLNALEKALKEGEIDQETYERSRSQIAGGDLSSTHLVKGLDFKLLNRIRQGEDISNETQEKSPEPEPESEPEADPDDVLDELESREVRPVEKEKVQKKGQRSLAVGQKRTRDQILAELKAAREAAKAKDESALGTRFRKIGAKQAPGTRIERDSKGREVMIIVDEDGNERRKVRKVDPSTSKEDSFKPDKSAEVLGMEVPEFYKKQQLEREREEEEKEGNIFDDAGSDYDPLAGLDESDDENSSQDEKVKGDEVSQVKDTEGTMPPPPKPQPPSTARNYFKDSKTSLASEQSSSGPSISDSAFLAALQKARALNAEAKSEEEVKAAEREARLKKMLQDSNRDDEDLDMGFGTNRLEDDADAEGSSKVKLSAWGDEGDDDGPGGSGKSKRKRGPKKRKGDKNNVADIMRVIESRKGGS
jgi:hypothetical protein